MKKLLFTILIFVAYAARSQGVGSYNNLDINDHFRLKGKTIRTIQDDSTLSGQSHTALPTEWAVWNFVTNRAGSGTSIDSATHRGDSVIFWHNGQALIQFKDSSFNQPLLQRYSVPFVGADGKMTEDNSHFKYSGGNLYVGSGGYYNSTGIVLNGGNGLIQAGGTGIQLVASGGQPADASKHIRFYNGQRMWLDMNLPNTGDPTHDMLEGTAYMNWSPGINDSFNLGKPTRMWHNAYVKNLWVNGTLFNPDLSGSYIPLTDKAVSNGVATLDGTGKIPLSQLPAITTNKPTYVQHLSDMLAQASTIGDITVVLDSSKTYALAQSPPTDFNNWLYLPSPVPTNTDLLPEGTSNEYFKTERVRNSLSAGDGINYNATTGIISKVKPDWDAAPGSPDEIVNKPAIPDEFAPVEGQHISITGTFPNLTLDTKQMYDSIQIDSITNKLRGEITVAAGGGVTISQVDSAVASQIPTVPTSLSSFTNDPGYITSSDTSTMLNKYLRKSDAFSKSYNDLTDKPTIPTVTGKMNYTDSAAMLSSYLRKIDTTGKWISPAVANATYATISNLNAKAGLGANTFTAIQTISSANYTPLVLERTSDNNNAQGFVFKKSRAGAGVKNGDQIVRLSGFGMLNDGTYATANNSQDFLSMEATEDFTTTAQGRQTSFYTVKNGTTTAIAALQLKNDGSVFTQQTITSSSFIKSGGTSSQFLKADGSVDANSYEPSITKNSAFNKTFGTTTGTVMDAGRIIDSLTAVNARLQGKLDSSFRDTINLNYPLKFDDGIKLSQSYLDSLVAKANPVFTGTAKINSDTLATKAYARSVGGSGWPIDGYDGLGEMGGYIDKDKYNTALGYLAGMDGDGNHNAGIQNLFFGYQAGWGKTNLNQGIYVGSGAGSSIENAENQIVIGVDAVGTKSKQITIGNGDITEFHTSGNMVVNGNAPSVSVGTNFTGTTTLGSTSNNTAGVITFNVSSAAAYAADSHIVDVGWGYQDYDAPPVVVISPASSNAVTDFPTVYVTNITTDGFSIAIANAGTSTVTSGYKWNYIVIQPKQN